MSIAERQRPKKRGIDEAENGGRRPDPQAEDSHRRGGKPRRLANQPERLTDILMKMHGP